MLKKMYEPKRKEMTGSWRQVGEEWLRDLRRSPNVILLIKSRRIRRAGLEAHNAGKYIRRFGQET